MYKAALLVLVALSLLHTSIEAQHKVSGAVIMLSKKDNGKTIIIQPKKPFNIVFEKECVGCAQVWKITSINTTKIKFLSNTYSDRSCANCTGGSHDNTFHFKTRKRGRSTLSFAYFDKRYIVIIKS